MASKITPQQRAAWTRRIVATYRRATPADMVDGATWYARARALATDLDPADPRRAAGVIAALSPRLTWTGNVSAARAAYAGLPIPTLKANALKARAILDGADPLDVLGGLKVRAFYACIVDDATDAVCVDMHAHDIAVGRVTDDATRGMLARVGAYDAVADAYRSAARIISRETGETVPAYIVQATTWVTWRRTDWHRHAGNVRRNAHAARTTAAVAVITAHAARKAAA